MAGGKWNFFLQSQRSGNPKFNSFTYSRRFILSLSMEASENPRWKTRWLQTQRWGRARPPLLSLKHFSVKYLRGFFLRQYIAQKNCCLYFFVVKILTWFLLQRFLNYFILNGDLPSLIKSSVCPMKVQCSCSFFTLGLANLFLSCEVTLVRWTEGAPTQSH